MKPIASYVREMLVSLRILGNSPKLQGLTKADALLASLIRKKKVPGLAITVVKDNAVFFQKGYGYADIAKKIPADPKRSVFRIASVSKPIAATALAKMVQEGLLDLDASFYTYVPYYPKKKYDFTIRQLASHTAGIRGYRGKEYALNQPFSIKESIAVFKDDALLFEPGTAYFYNSFDWVLISLAMQEVSGMPFETLVAHYVLEPLGLTNTFPEKTDALPPDTVVFYSKTVNGFTNATPVNNLYKLAGGGYLSTSEDIARFGQAYLNRSVLDEGAVAQFLTSEIINGTPTYYGLGWQVSRDTKGRPYYGHVGNGVGGYALFYAYPEEQMVFSILMNSTNPGIEKDLDEIVDVLIGSQHPNTKHQENSAA
ncbi:serine hydrolase domain-containing protein [Arenibacter sp. GZD96]|uniref:serine hydrolase domain-containing protein n=1 Tax=Aurantibrevibacter litoralis TaxID=3106030 RepID=UPI002AFDE755|nr:serine hydrolase domain-containing protein [Arenibacter sp. GZD-96]MEA1787306.1 serine hydrolase domain-containing protein [Arenibacter sp. GZD-96]